MSRLLTPTSLAAVDPVATLHRLQTDGDDAPARLVPGSRLFVEVIAPLADGGVRARALDGSGDYRLAFNAPTGARLEVVVSDEDAAAPAAAAPGKPTRDAIASISNTGRLVAALAPNADNGARPGVIIGRVPLILEAPTNPAMLRLALAHALANSGLFYEAHQAQWVSGTRPRESLLQEPQGRMTLREVRADRDRWQAERLDSAATSFSNASAPEGGKPTLADIETVVHRTTVPLVQQQLAALETGAVVWRGELLRGQMFEWEVRRDDGRAADRDAARPAAGSWSTRLRLTLPLLGTVEAALWIDAHGVDVRIAAHEAATGEALRTNMSSLAAALSQAGLKVRRVEVQRGE